MSGWINWRAIEKGNVWGVRRKDDEEAASWGSGAAQWEERAINDGDFTIKQVEALRQISNEDTVLEVGCGTGPLAIPIAKIAKSVTAQDYAPEMLSYVERKAKQEGLTNISYLQGNWFSMEPERDVPLHDIVVARHAPCQSDILKFSRCARKYCYSLWYCAPFEKEPYDFNPGIPTDPKVSPHRRYNEPNGRLFGYNVHFNLLYDLGANPTIEHVVNERVIVRATYEEVIEALFPNGKLPPAEFLNRMAAMICELEDGSFRFRQIMKMSVLGWDPNEIHYEEVH